MPVVAPSRAGSAIQIRPEEWAGVIADTDGPQLIIAGPGAGKTEFLARRAAYLIDRITDRADEVLVLTFNREAAGDLRRRIACQVERPVNRIAALTFHSFAHHLLEATSAEQAPSPLTGPEQVALVGELLKEEQPSAWPHSLRGLLTSTTLAVDVTDFLLRCTERLISPRDLEELSADRADWRALPGFYRRYVEALRDRGRIDYGSLLARAVEVLGDPSIRAAIAEQHRYLLVDEYQDTSPAQVELCRLLAEGSGNISVAGDPYQSVFSFRGAELSHIEQFCDRFRDANGFPARRLVLTTSFRVPRAIFEAALRVTASGDLPGTAGAVLPAPHAGAVEAHVFDQASAEAEWIASEVHRLHLMDRLPYSQMAVLLRSKRNLGAELSRALDRRGIPHNTPYERLVDHPAVSALLDLALAASLIERREASEEIDAVMRRILLGPFLEATVGQQRALLRQRQRTHESWSSILRSSFPRLGEEIAELLDDASWAVDLPAVEGFWMVWDHLSAVEAIVRDPKRKAERLAWTSFAQTLQRQLERSPGVSLLEFREIAASEDFEATPLLSYTPSPADELMLTTLHQAKGLEFEVVFIADATEGSFPDPRRDASLVAAHALSPSRSTNASDLVSFRLQEEMRLAYTGMTRARSRVVWTATNAGSEGFGRQPSRFLLAAAGVTSLDGLPERDKSESPPLTSREAQAFLRRLLADPATSPSRRLAAVTVLAGSPKAPWDASTFATVRLPGPDTGLVEDGLRLSPSQAESYASCPRAYALERRLGIGATTSKPAELGNAIHAALELAERAALERGDPRSNPDEALGYLEQAWCRASHQSNAHDAARHRKAVDAIRRLYARWPADSACAIAVEHPVEVEIAGRRWIGRADRIERTTSGQIRIVDYKTGTRVPSIAETARSLQLGFYLLAASSDPVIADQGPVGQAEMWYLRSPGNSWRRAFDPSNLEEIEAELAKIAEGIAEESWAPRLGRGCDWCQVKVLCPLWPEGQMAYTS